MDTTKNIEERYSAGQVVVELITLIQGWLIHVQYIIESLLTSISVPSCINNYSASLPQLATRGGLDGCRDDVSPTDVSPNENPCILLRLYY
jgi:hypothetical protein